MPEVHQLLLPTLHLPGPTSIEICAGAGGQALGLESAGFQHLALVELEEDACATLRLNRPTWNVIQGDLREFTATQYQGVDLLAGGVPCPPFSIAGKQLGDLDERNLFPAALRIVRECRPRAVMLENVRGLLGKAFDQYRSEISNELEELGYIPAWKLLNASDYGVPQLRPRAILVALRDMDMENFSWPSPLPEPPPTVGETLYEMMASNGWPGAKAWAEMADAIAPTLVGGSHKHGGPDLGPTRAREAWARLGVKGTSLANEVPGPDFDEMPRLTVEMTARIQGFPPEWRFAGSKTSTYRQIGNAFPPPVAAAVGRSILSAIATTDAQLLEEVAD